MELPAQPGLLELPLELIEHIAGQITDSGDLSNMRMACRMLDKPAAKQLFKSAYLSPSEEAVDTWNSTSEHNVIRQMPRHAIIHTQPNTEAYDPWYGDRERVEISEGFLNALAALSRYPNVATVEIEFTADCKGRFHESWEDDVAENPAEREEMLRIIFQAIKDRSKDVENRTIRKLTITNLQNCPIPDFTSSELFRSVMGQLDELHVSLIQEYNEAGPDHDYAKVELQTFPAHLCADWLAPISENLKALSIYHRNENWGPFPGYFDFSGIEFSKLETLALGYYTFAHDQDLDWITAIKSLRKLVLHNCMIASYIRISRSNMAEWKMPTHDWIPMTSDDGSSWCASFKYEGEWSSYLDRIATGLPNLIDFKFDYGDTHDHDDDDCAEQRSIYGVRHRDDCGASVFSKRYVVFDNGILPTHWPEASEDGELHNWQEDTDGFPNLHSVCLEEDAKSLNRLLEEVRRRR